MKATATAAVILVIGVGAWNAGELHRQNCERASRTSCSVLPWDAGHAKPLTLEQKYGLAPRP